jgi:DNA modification methylase
VTTTFDIQHGDCLDLMKHIPDGSVDMVLCDLPYGTTECAWDAVIPFNILWEHYTRLIKPDGAIVLNSAQPFTSYLITSNPRLFRYCWYWKKEQGTGVITAKKKPLRIIEEIVVFSKNATTIYNPQMKAREKPIKITSTYKSASDSEVRGLLNKHVRISEATYPTTFLEFCRDRTKALRGLHPTQKPVALGEYLIRTYTSEGETVLDNTMGSGSFGVAAINTGRNFIGIERDEKYFKTAKRRIETAALLFEERLSLLSQ